MRESSEEEATRRTDKCAAMRTLSSALDHKSRHVYDLNSVHQTGQISGTHFEVQFHAFSAVCNIWHDLRSLGERKNLHILISELCKEINGVVEI